MEKIRYTPVVFAVFSFLWIYPMLHGNVRWQLWLFFAVFTLAAATMLFIRNNALTLIGSIIAVGVVSIADIKELCTLLPGVLLVFVNIYLHRFSSERKVLPLYAKGNAKQNSRNQRMIVIDNTDIFITYAASATAVTVSIVFLFIKLFEDTDQSVPFVPELRNMIVPGFFLICTAVLLFSFIRNKEFIEYAEKIGYSRVFVHGLRCIHISFLAVSASGIVSFYLLQGNAAKSYDRVFFLSLFVFIFTAVFKQDSVVLFAIERLKTAVERFSEDI